MSTNEENVSSEEIEENDDKKIIGEHYPSNKNFLIGHLYNKTSDLSEDRVSLRYREVVRDEILEKKSKLVSRIMDNPENKYEIREANKELEKQIKEVEKNEEDNEKQLELLRSRIHNGQVYVRKIQEELAEAEEYKTPAKI